VLLEGLGELGMFCSGVFGDFGQFRQPGGEIVDEIGEGAQGVHLACDHTLVVKKDKAVGYLEELGGSGGYFNRFVVKSSI
jgi:predicted NUDIX family NTP pyrophosphohydrolase